MNTFHAYILWIPLLDYIIKLVIRRLIFVKVYYKYLIYDAYLIDKYIKGKIEESVKIPFIILLKNLYNLGR